jgi:hypothetical protein
MEKYWIVVLAGNNPTPYRHASLALARADAEKIARENPNNTVTVLEAMCLVQVEIPLPPPCVWRVAVAKDDSVPF